VGEAAAALSEQLSDVQSNAPIGASAVRRMSSAERRKARHLLKPPPTLKLLLARCSGEVGGSWRMSQKESNKVMMNAFYTRSPD
jgi:hypothetical protein